MEKSDCRESRESCFSLLDFIEKILFAGGIDDRFERIHFCGEIPRNDELTAESEAFEGDHSKADEQTTEQGIHEMTTGAEVFEGSLKCGLGCGILLCKNKKRVHVRSRSCR